MSELSQGTSRSNKDGNRRVTAAYFSPGRDREARVDGGGATMWRESGGGY